MAEKIRLQKILAENGIASRRKSEEIIASGRVTVNGVRAKVGDKADPDRDRILIDGEPFLSGKEKNVYIMLHKPRGFVTTMNDEMGRKCVAQLVEDVGVRVFPVGRLDRDSEGLLLFTNDGEFANMMMHPSMHVSKTYRVTVREKVSENQLTALASGIMIDGRKTLPADIKILLTESDSYADCSARGQKPSDKKNVRGIGSYRYTVEKNVVRYGKTRHVTARKMA